MCSPAPRAALNAGSGMSSQGALPAANSCCQHAVYLPTCWLLIQQIDKKHSKTGKLA